MWTAPVPQEFFEVWSDRLHPYVRPVDAIGIGATAGQDGFPRREFQTRQRPLRANGSHGLSRTLDRSDPAIYSSCSSGSVGQANPADW